jgi:magnesium transporter
MEPCVNIFRDGAADTESLPLSRLSDVAGQPGVFVWVELSGADDAELRSVATILDLHHLAVEDALHAHQRPKIDTYDDQAFVVAYSASLQGDRRVALTEVSVFVSPHYGVTVGRGKTFAGPELRQRLSHALKAARHPGAVFAYVLLDQIVDDYFEVLDGVQDRIEELEEALVWSHKREARLDMAFAVRRDVIYFRRAVAPLREVLNVLLRRDDAIVDDDMSPYLRDLYDHVVRVYEELDTGHDLISAALEAHLSLVSTDMNETVLKVSAWAAIIALPTVIASVYGMNFDNMPELRWHLGYPYAIALMVGSAASLYLYFKRHRWL